MKEFDQIKVPPAFFLKSFLKSFIPCVSKDVTTSEVFSEEEDTMRSQQLDLIYSQSGMLYHILLDAP
jgi:hypothetical protein